MSTTPAQGVGAAPVQGANAALAVPAYYLPFQRAPHAHAVHLAGSPQIAQLDGHLSTYNSPWVSRHHPEMGPAAPTLQHGPYRPGPQQHGQRLLTSCPTSNNRATNQGQYFWDSEKRHYQSECLKAAATNAVRPEPLEPYAEYGYLTNQPYNGKLNTVSNIWGETYHGRHGPAAMQAKVSTAQIPPRDKASNPELRSNHARQGIGSRCRKKYGPRPTSCSTTLMVL